MIKTKTLESMVSVESQALMSDLLRAISEYLHAEPVKRLSDLDEDTKVSLANVEGIDANRSIDITVTETTEENPEKELTYTIYRDSQVIIRPKVYEIEFVTLDSNNKRHSLIVNLGTYAVEASKESSKS